MRRVALAAVLMGAGFVTVGCSAPEEVPDRTRAECRDQPYLSGCSYGLPIDVVERRRERAERQAAEREERRAERQAAKADRLWRRAQKPVRVDESIEDILDDMSSPASVSSAGPPEVSSPSAGRRCWDVTSYDYNWNNDVLCQRLDGTRFYTSYEGADAFLAGY